MSFPLLFSLYIWSCENDGWVVWVFEICAIVAFFTSNIFLFLDEDVVTFLALKQRIDRLFMKCPPHTCLIHTLLKISVNGTLPCLLVYFNASIDVIDGIIFKLTVFGLVHLYDKCYLAILWQFDESFLTALRKRSNGFFPKNRDKMC